MGETTTYTKVAEGYEAKALEDSEINKDESMMSDVEMMKGEDFEK